MYYHVDVIWTALPNGFVPDSSSKLRLSLFASIQLTSDDPSATLANFPLGNWTEIVSHYSFDLLFGAVRKRAVVKNEFHSEMWTALFGDYTSARRSSGMTVKPHQPPVIGPNALSNAEIITFPVKPLASRLREAYKGLANTQTRLQAGTVVASELKTAQTVMSQLRDDLSIYLPPNATEDDRLATLKAIKELNDFINRLSPVKKPMGLALRDVFLGRVSKSEGRDLRAEALTEIDRAIRQHFPEELQISSQPSPMSAFTRFINFHSPGHEPEISSTRAGEPPDFDFHERLTMLSNYPVLMRMLGLVVDVEVDVNGTSDIPSPGAVRVNRVGDPNPHPKTNYNLNFDTRRFLPRPNDTDPLIRDGLLDLRAKVDGEDSFYLESLDVDGALLKHLALTSGGERVTNTCAATLALDRLSDDEVPPALRTLGISVVYSNRDKFLKRLLRHAENNAQNPREADLWAEDLLRGFRVDVFEAETGNWYSLCERAEKYHFLKPGSQEVLFTSPPEGAYNTEGIVHLGVTKPMQPSSGAAGIQLLQQHQSLFYWNNWSLSLPLPQRPLDAKTHAVREDKEPPLRLKSEFDIIPKRLPKLRFGHRYYLRCRVVDPAGNSLNKDDINRTDFSTALGDGDCPFFFSRYEPVPPPVLLVQSGINPEKTPGEQLDRPVIRDGKSSSERCVAPARTMAMTAIIDGRYDDGTNRNDGAFEGAQLCKETGDFPQVKSADPAFQSPLYLYQPANAESPEQPYLPDPYATGACVALGTLSNQPLLLSAAENELACGFYRDNQDWPHAQPFLVRLVPAPSNQREIARLRQRSSLQPFVTIAEVSLLPGEMVKLRLSSMMGDIQKTPTDTRNLEKMAYWRITHPDQSCAAKVAETTEFQQRAICGEFPLYTPPRDLMLVHAVKKPLGPRLLDLNTESRKLGETSVDVTFLMNLHRASTGRIECEATWHEPIDDVSQPECTKRAGSAHVGDEKIALQGEICKSNPAEPLHEDFPPFKFKQNFGDTKHRRITYTVRATTRFREYYPQPKEPRDDDERAKIQRDEHDTYTTALVDANEPKIILSTARPPAPQLAYVVPTFRWEQSVPKNAGPESRRWGGGLRIYLERPWFTTGEGELLGVVLYPRQLSVQLCKVMAPHVTQWGRDPIWGTNPLPDFPKREDFRHVGAGALTYEDGLSLEALKGLDPLKVGCTAEENFRVAVAGFEPEFDADRKLWRCDIAMNPGKSYFPLVRLALARYQPHSLAGENDCKLSAVVQAEFMQLTPDRWASMQYESDPHRVNLTVTGFSYQSRSAVPGSVIRGTSVVNIALEERCSNREGDLRWQRISIQGGSENGLLAPTSVTNNANGETVWQFQITLPRSRKVSRYRAVIFESEVIAQDKNNGPIEYSDGSRLVYADVLGV